MNTSNNNCKTLFLIFHQVMNFCEGNSVEKDVEIMFKSAKILEDTCEELENIEASESFEAKLREFSELEGLKCVPLQFFKKASHHILSRYIVDDKFSDSEVTNAIHQFITSRSEKELCELVQQLADTHQTVETLRTTYYSLENIMQYKAEEYLEKLRQALINNGGDVDEIYSEIFKSILNDNNTFKIFLKVLCVPSECGIILNIQVVVALCLSKLLKQCDNINLFSYLFDLDTKDFNHIFIKWRYFIEAFLQATRISAERLHCNYSGNSYTWTNTEAAPCLNFIDIVKLINRCKCLPGVNSKIKEFLQQIGEEGFRILAEDIIQKCHIK